MNTSVNQKIQQNEYTCKQTKINKMNTSVNKTIQQHAHLCKQRNSTK